MILNLRLNHRNKILLPEMLEPLYEQGLSRAEVARRLGLTYSYLSKRLNESFSLEQAEKRGQASYQARLRQEMEAA